MNTTTLNSSEIVRLTQKDVTMAGWTKAGNKLSQLKDSHSSVTIVFHNVRYVSSGVLTSLVETRTRLKDLGYDLKLSINTEELLKLFKVLRFDTIFTVEYMKAA